MQLTKDLIIKLIIYSKRFFAFCLTCLFFSGLFHFRLLWPFNKNIIQIYLDIYEFLHLRVLRPVVILLVE